MNTEPTNDTRTHFLLDPPMDNADYQRVLDAACGYESLGLLVEAEAELASLDVPMRWRDRYESVRCRVA